MKDWRRHTYTAILGEEEAAFIDLFGKEKKRNKEYA